MLGKIICYFLQRSRYRKLLADRKRHNKFVVSAIHNFMQSQWEKAKYEKIIGLETRTWVAGNLTIVHHRQIRGDLITLTLVSDNPMARAMQQPQVVGQWVDQSHAYPGFLGLNDIRVNYHLTLEYIESQLSQFAAVKESAVAVQTH